MIRYEMCKILKNKKIILSIMAILLVQIIVFWFMQQGTSPYEYRNYIESYGQELEKISYDSSEEGIEKLTEYQDIAIDFQYHYGVVVTKVFTQQQVEEYHKYLVETYGQEALEFAEEQNKSMNILQSGARVYLAGKWIDQLKYQNRYREFRQSIEQGDSHTVALFQKNKEFTDRNEKKTRKAYEKLGEISFSPGSQFMAKGFLKFNLSGVFLVAIVFILAMGVFRPDQEKQMLQFLKTQKNGRSALLGAKLVTLFCFTFISILAMEFVRLLASYYLYGGVDWKMPIQAVEEYRNCCLPWNLAQFIIAGILVKCIVGFILGILCAVFLVYFRKNWMFYLVMLGILGTEWVLYENVLPTGSFSILKYANLVQGMCSFELFGRYENCNCFGFAVNKMFIFGLFVVFLCVLGIWQCCRCWKLQKEEQREAGKVKMVKHMGRISLPISVQQIYFLHEKKFYLCGIMVAFGIYCGFFRGVYMLPTTLTQVGYQEWVEKYQGELTDEKIASIEGDRKRYDDLWERVGELALMENPDTEEKLELDALSAQTGTPYDSFCEFLEQYEYVKERKNVGKNAFLLDKYHWSRLYNGFAKEIKNMGLALVCCILLCASLFEDKRNIGILLNSTKNGRRKLWRCKYLLGVQYAVFSWTCCVLPELARFIRTNHQGSWVAFVNNLPIFEEASVELPIYVTVIGIYLVQLLLCVLCSLIIMYFVDVTNNSFLSISVTAVTILIALIILYRKKAGIISTWVTMWKNPLTPCLVLGSVCLVVGVLIVCKWEREWRKDVTRS